MNTLGFYHKSDLDGRCSGAILKYHIPDITLVGIDHGDPFPWNMINSGTIVYMCDFSLPDINLMYRLWEKSAEFIWIDHHKSAIERYNTFCNDFYAMNRTSWSLSGSRSIGKAACELTWEWFHPNEEVPLFIELLGAYDTWRNSDQDFWENTVLPFQYGIQMYDLNPETHMDSWEIYFEDSDPNFSTIPLIITDGQSILHWNYQRNAQNVERNAYEAEFEGIRAICINSSEHSSSILDSAYNPDVHDIMIVYTHQKDSWYVSLYSTKNNIDCSKLASKYGGGGHFSASGFRISNDQNLPWSIL